MDLKKIKNNEAKMLIMFSIPSIIAMLLTSAITLVDGYFIGNYIGKEGTAAVNLGLPLVYIFLGVGLMMGVGGISLAGISFGKNDVKKCNQIFRQSITMSIIVSLILTVIVAILFFPLANLLDINTCTRDYFKTYYFIMLFQFPFMVVNSCLGMFMRGDGKPQYSMLISILSLILNGSLDYLAVAVLDLGIAGIAVSSLIAVVICTLLSALFFIKKADIYHFGTFKFEKEITKNIIFNGSSEFIGEISMCITMAAYNAIILNIKDVDGVAAFAIVGYTSYIFNMFILGIGQGMSPMLSVAYGAKDFNIVKSLRKYATIFSEVIGISVFALLTLAKKGYSELFINDSDVIKIINTGIVIFAISFLVEGINIVASFFFTSLGKAKESAVISAARGLVLIILALIILPIVLGMTGVWLVAPVTEILTLFISIFYYKKLKLA